MTAGEDGGIGDQMLNGEALQRCLDADLTYPEVGATRGALPAAYHHLDERSVIGTGPSTFEAATTALLSWEMHRRAGIGVVPSAPAVAPGVVAVLRIGRGPVAVRAPVRVVHEVDEPDRRGFAYGTLPGHPESGEEAFVVEHDESGTVSFRITAFSRPATRLTRWGGPVARLAQRVVTRRYLRALRV